MSRTAAPASLTLARSTVPWTPCSPAFSGIGCNRLRIAAPMIFTATTSASARHAMRMRSAVNHKILKRPRARMAAPLQIQGRANKQGCAG